MTCYCWCYWSLSWLFLVWPAWHWTVACYIMCVWHSWCWGSLWLTPCGQCHCTQLIKACMSLCIAPLIFFFFLVCLCFTDWKKYEIMYLYSFSALDIQLFVILWGFGITPTSLRIYEYSLRCLCEEQKTVIKCSKLLLHLHNLSLVSLHLLSSV